MISLSFFHFYWLDRHPLGNISSPWVGIFFLFETSFVPVHPSLARTRALH